MTERRCKKRWKIKGNELKRKRNERKKYEKKRTKRTERKREMDRNNTSDVKKET